MIDCSGTVAVCTRGGENSRKSTFELMFRHRLSQVALMHFKSTFTTKDSFFVEICVLYRRGNARILLRLRRWSAWSKRYRNTQSHNPSACFFFNFGFFRRTYRVTSTFLIIVHLTLLLKRHNPCCAFSLYLFCFFPRRRREG